MASSTFDIEIRYFGGAFLYDVFFEAAATRWEQIIIADLPDVGVIDDLLIDVTVGLLDGVGDVLAQAGLLKFRDLYPSLGSVLPFYGAITVDQDDINALYNAGTLESLIIHEMGHVLGIGSALWDYFGLTNGFNYTGSNAVAEYRNLTGDPSLTAIPLETEGGVGTAATHWSEDVFDRELMTGFQEPTPPNPLSRISIASLADLGYTVNYGLADAFSLPNVLVDDSFYYAANPDVLAAGMDADAHYAQYGWREGRDPNAWFDTTSYLSANRDVQAVGINPLEHYRLYGWKEGRDPSLNFDPQLYLKFNPDVAAAGVDPLFHYLAYGRTESRPIYDMVGESIQNGFDAEFYLLANPDVGAASMDALFHFNNYGRYEGRDPNGWFDTSGYLDTYGDVKAAGVNPLDHYMLYGANEGRDPSAEFDTSSYLAIYSDVAVAGVNPLQHYLQYGIYEGRQAFGDGLIG